MKIEYEEKEVVKREGKKAKVEKVEEMKVVKEEDGEERVLDTVPDVVAEMREDPHKVEVKNQEPMVDIPLSEALKEEEEAELKEEVKME